MAVSYVNKASNTSTTTSVAVTKPSSLQDGDIIIAHVVSFRSSSNSPGAIASTSSYFTQIATRTTSRPISSIWYRVVTNAAGEPASYTFTSTNATQMNAIITVYRGCIPGASLVDAYSNTAYTTANTTCRGATTTPTRANGMFVYCGWGYYATGTPALSNPSGMNDRQVLVNTNNASRISDLEFTTADASGTKDGTLWNASQSTKHAFVIALKSKQLEFSGTINGTTSTTATLTVPQTYQFSGTINSATTTTAVLNKQLSFSGTINSSTSTTAALIKQIAITDTIDCSTSTTAALIKNIAVLGTINSSTSTTASVIRVMGLADTIDLTTSTSSILNRIVDIADTVNTTSTTTSSLIKVVGLSDTIDTTTTNSASVIRVVGLSDTISVVTTNTSLLSTVGQVAFTGTITSSTTTTATATSDIKLSDTISVATTTTAALQTIAYKEFSDTINVTTSTTGAIVRTVGLTDTLSTTTTTTATASNVLALSDTINTSTTTNAVLQTSAFKEFSGTVTSATITTALINRVVNLQDIIETSTTTTAQAVLLKNLSGTFGCSVNNNGGLLLDKSLQGLFSVVTDNTSILSMIDLFGPIYQEDIYININNNLTMIEIIEE